MAACVTRLSWTTCLRSLMGEVLQRQQLALHRQCSGQSAVLAGLQPALLVYSDEIYCRDMQGTHGETLPSPCVQRLQSKDFSLISHVDVAAKMQK